MTKPVRALAGLVVALLVVWLLFTKVFPWVDANLLNDPTLEASTSSDSA
jgi:hypothetical protein